MRFDIKLGNSYANVPRPSIGEVVAKINAQTRQSFQWLLILGATLLLSLLAVAIAPLWMAGIILITGLGILGLTLRDRQRQRMK
jgi:Flp pilus assembly protein TadB